MITNKTFPLNHVACFDWCTAHIPSKLKSICRNFHCCVANRLMHSRPKSVLRTCSRRLRKGKRIRIARFGFGLLQVNRLSYYFCCCFDQISVNCFQVILVRQKIKLDIREISEISFPRNSHWTSCAVFMPWDSFPRLSVIDLLCLILQAERTRQHPRRISRKSR